MGLTILAYNMKRTTKILGVEPILAALKAMSTRKTACASFPRSTTPFRSHGKCDSIPRNEYSHGLESGDDT